MRAKSLLGVLVLVHVLVHPVAHALFPVGAAAPQVEPFSPNSRSTLESVSLGPCLGCRTGSSLIAAPAVSLPAPLPTAWEKTSPPASDQVFLQRFLEVPARAPPSA